MLEINLKKRETIALYLHLKKDPELKDDLNSVFYELEQWCFRNLRIEDMEHLEERYQNDPHFPREEKND